MAPVKDKNFLKFLGKTLIEHQIENVKNAGFSDITIIGGAHNLDNLKGLGVNVVQQEDLDQGMAGAMMSLEEHLGDEPIMLLSANDYLEDKAFELMKNAAENSDAEAYLLAKKVDSYFPGGYLKIDEGKVTEIVEKPGEGNEPSDMINIVLHVFKNPKKFIQKIRNTKSEQDDWYEVALDEMMKEGIAIEAVPYDGYWQAIKFPWHILKLQQYFLENIEGQNISTSAQIADTAVIKGDVIVEEGVKVFDNAVINGPAYIGANTVIANNALVRDSIVGADSVIGYNTEVARSHLGEGIWLHMNYVGDSVLCDNVALGGGTVTGNFRLDEGEVGMNVKGQKFSTQTNKLGVVIGEGCRVGINVSTMPGIKIGGDSFIAGGLIIAEDIPEGSFVKGKTDLDIRENKFKSKKRNRL